MHRPCFIEKIPIIKTWMRGESWNRWRERKKTESLRIHSNLSWTNQSANKMIAAIRNLWKFPLQKSPSPPWLNGNITTVCCVLLLLLFPLLSNGHMWVFFFSVSYFVKYIYYCCWRPVFDVIVMIIVVGVFIFIHYQNKYTLRCYDCMQVNDWMGQQ